MAKSFVGIVASDKNDKTISVLVTTHKTHPIYKKRYISSKRFLAHDEKNEAGEGDKVRIAETRPISAKKRFVLTKVIEKAGVTHQETEPEIIKEITEKTPPKTKPAAKKKEAAKAESAKKSKAADEKETK